jgi:hypothetical protein
VGCSRRILPWIAKKAGAQQQSRIRAARACLPEDCMASFWSVSVKTMTLSLLSMQNTPTFAARPVGHRGVFRVLRWIFLYTFNIRGFLSVEKPRGGILLISYKKNNNNI